LELIKIDRFSKNGTVGTMNRLNKWIKYIKDNKSKIVSEKKSAIKYADAIDFINEIENITNEKILHTIQDVEPLGPKDMLDILKVKIENSDMLKT
jgi:hypothetical protein